MSLCASFVRVFFISTALVFLVACGNGASESADTNNGPIPSILQPASNTTHLAGSVIEFRGKGSDIEDGDLSNQALVWESDIDGVIGNGETFTANLSAGTHTISFTATDSDGASARSFISITIVEPTSVGTLSNKMAGFNFINQGAAQADSYALFLDLNASSNRGVVAFYVSESLGNNSIPSTPSVDQDGWISINKTVSINRSEAYILSQNYDPGSTISLYVWFKDEQGNVSNVAIDAIQLNITAQGLPYVQGFENGLDGWTTEGDVWEVGAVSPSYGPLTAAAGNSVIGTILSGFHPAQTSSRIISPEIVLPVVNTIGREIRFEYEMYAHIFFEPKIFTEISIETSPGVWGEWTTLKQNPTWAISWMKTSVDVTKYRGRKVRFAFNFVNLGDSEDHNGWLVDQVKLSVVKEHHVTKENSYEESFESGLANWTTSNGIWNASSASLEYGPKTSADGNQHITGDLTPQLHRLELESKLISPIIALTTIEPNEQIELRFSQWFALTPIQKANVQVSVYNGNFEWSDFAPLKTEITSTSYDWGNSSLDLTAYAGRRIRIAFSINNPNRQITPGWNIDNISINIKPIISVSSSSAYTTGFENGWEGWSEVEGIWEVGSSSMVAAKSGSSVIGTVLNGNTPDRDARLTSPAIALPNISDTQEIRANFFHSFALWATKLDIQVSVYGEDKVWSDWQTLKQYINNSNSWSNEQIDLSAFAGSTIKLSFFKQAYPGNGESKSPGYYLDNFKLEVAPVIDTSTSWSIDFNQGFNGWWDPYGMWEIGELIPGVGPENTLEGGQVVATNIAGMLQRTHYFYSPTYAVPASGGFTNFVFKAWHDLGNGFATLQISVNEEDFGWSSWSNIITPMMGLSPDLVPQSGGWRSWTLSLAPYAGQQVRLRFEAINSSPDPSPGIYLNRYILTSQP